MDRAIAMPTMSAQTALQVLPSTFADRGGIRDILLGSGIFSQGDADTVDEMFVEAFNKPSDDNYQFLSCWNESQLAGFACFGRESLTQGTWDLFWVCVSSAARRMGVGSALLREVMRRAAQEHVRLMVIYTSSTDRYAPARALYESHGFERAAVIPDYYAAGDDLLIYTQRIGREE